MHLTCECGNGTFNIDTTFNNTDVTWLYATCQKCLVKYQIYMEQKNGKMFKNGIVKIKDVTSKCPKCKTNGFESFWNKHTQSYDAVCEKCGYKKSEKY